MSAGLLAGIVAGAAAPPIRWPISWPRRYHQVVRSWGASRVITWGTPLHFRIWWAYLLRQRATAGFARCKPQDQISN